MKTAVPFFLLALSLSAQRKPGSQLDHLPANIEVLTHFDWPGNVRELQNVIRRACLLSADRTIGAAVLSLQQTPALEEPSVDRAVIEQALSRARGVVAHAARDLGMSRQALYRRMEKLGIKTEAGRPPASS